MPVMQFLIAFNGESNEDLTTLEQAYMENEHMRSNVGVDLIFPNDVIIPPFEINNGEPTIVDFKIIVSLLNLTKYNKISIIQSTREEFFSRELKSLRPFMIVPTFSLHASLISPITTYHIEGIDPITSDIQHGANIKIKIFNLSLNPIQIRRGDRGFRLISSNEILPTRMKIISKHDFIYSDEFIAVYREYISNTIQARTHLSNN